MFSWPPRGFSTTWWDKALHNDGVVAAVWTSVKAGLGATAIALLLGSMVAFAVVRYSWFGRDPVSFLVVLPIALPGIVTGIALNAAFSTVLGPLGISFGLFTVILGHATFCIVVVFNNVAARLRRTGPHARGGVDGPRRRHVHHVPAGSPSRRSGRPWSPVRCWPSRCRSTRSW